MSLRSRKITAVILLIPAWAPLIYYAAFLFLQFSIRAEMREKLEGDSLVTIHVRAENLEWIKGGNEICIGGKLFDVKAAVHEPDGTLTLTGLFDQEESLLLGQLQEQEEDTRNSEQVMALFQMFEAIPRDPPKWAAPLFLSNYVISANETLHSKLAENIPTPPPQV